MRYAKLILTPLLIMAASAIPVSAHSEHQASQKSMTYKQLQKLSQAYQTGREGHRGAFLKTAMQDDPTGEFTTCMTSCHAEYGMNIYRCAARPTINPSDDADCEMWADDTFLACQDGCRAIW